MKTFDDIIDGESIEEFESLKESLHAQYKPTTLLETALVQSITEHEWYMRRAVRLKEMLAAVEGEDELTSEVKTLVRFYRRHHVQAEKEKRRLQSLQEKRIVLEDDSEAATLDLLGEMKPVNKWVN